ncbi:MAG: AAA family ATPase [Coleofasciculaceae cyanobacterium]
MSCPIVKLAGYRLSDKIHEDCQTLIYRGVRSHDEQPVVVKLLKSEYPTFLELMQFCNQYLISKNLALPGVVKPLGLEKYGNGFALVMPDFGGISLKQEMEKDTFSLDKFFRIAPQIVQTLEGLHRQQIIHKDIKPQNILVNPETLEVKLIDFSICSLLPKENQASQNPNLLEGTLAYMSPEQTGRINRGIDYRTDFYSLGVTFYELLTGQLPFQSNEPMELVYYHLAQLPTPPVELKSAIPLAVNDIVLKLMAKTPEERYQSAGGLKYDLEVCYEQWQTGITSQFTLGKQDISEQFFIPEKLYGREKEVTTLLANFEQVSQGSSAMILVTGFSGIGKSALVNEVHQPIVKKRGYFIKGKFDQFKSHIPFFAFVQAFQDLIKQILSENAYQVETWKSKILGALGQQARVIIEVIPELEVLIGEQPRVPEISASAAKQRFNLLFGQFIRVFTSQEHPLVIFLDDLQWADSTSLQLMQLLISETESPTLAEGLLIIGAYRDNEVSRVHPLILALDEIGKTKAKVSYMSLEALNQSSLNCLIADSLNCSPEKALPLTELVHQKTKGNPFFSREFLKSLYQDGLIFFSHPDSPHSKGGWQCDISQVKLLSLSDDVIDFMASRLRKLPESTQSLLKLAACIGSRFDLLTLAIVQEKSLSETAADLWSALQEGLIIPLSKVYKFFSPTEAEESLNLDYNLLNDQSSSYKFLHDRVQQAAYFLIPEKEKLSTHLKIGQLLLSNTTTQKLEDKIFDIVNQLNRGIGSKNEDSLIENCLLKNNAEQLEHLEANPLAPREIYLNCSEENLATADKIKLFKLKLAQLNLIAGHKAKSSTAYAIALNYLRVGLRLLASDSWQSQYELTLALHESAAEAAYLSGDFEQMENLAEIVLQQTEKILDQVKIYEIKISAYQAQNKPLTAINTAREILQMLCFPLPEEPGKLKVLLNLVITKLASITGQIEDLDKLPEMTNPVKLATMGILLNVGSASYFAVPNLYALIVFKQVNLSIKYGNVPASAFAYATYGSILCGIVGDIDSGYRFGQLALDLVEQLNAKEVEAKTIFVVNCLVRHWQEHLHQTLPSFQTAYQIGRATGDLEFSALSLVLSISYSYFSGIALTVIERESEISAQLISELKQETALYSHQLYRQVLFNLMGYSDNPCYLVGDSYDEQVMLPLHQQANDRTALYGLYLHKIILCYLFRVPSQSVKNAKIARQYLDGGTATFSIVVFHFYDSLSQLEIYACASSFEQKAILKQVNANQKKLKKWAYHAPMNHLHKFYLVEAERHCVLGQDTEAMNCYERAINGAKEHGFLQEEALANELAARFYLNRGKEKIAQVYLNDAYYCYVRWGAKAKLENLENEYPQLLAPILNIQKTNTDTDKSITEMNSPNFTLSKVNASNLLDLAAVIKTSQAISGVMCLDQLLSTLLQLVLENAGAEKCTLILSKAGNLVIEATAVGTALTNKSSPKNNILQTEFAPSLLSIPVESSQQIPISVINYVWRTQTTLVLGDATAEHTFAADPYIIREQPKSLLCTPIINQGKQIGIIYLENNLIKDAFTSDRLALLQLITSQAAISLENAQLYEQLKNYSHTLEEKVEERTKKLQEEIYSRQQVEDALRLSEEKFSKAFRSSPEPIAISTLEEGRYLEVNESFLELSGFTRAEVIGYTSTELNIWSNPTDRTRLIEILQEQGAVRNQEFDFYTKLGKLKKLLLSVERIELGGQVCLLTLARDITERKQAEEALRASELREREKAQQLELALDQLKRTQTQLVQTEKMSSLGQMLAGVAHEINNPVSFIYSNLDPAQEYFQGLVNLVQTYQQTYPNSTPEIEKISTQIELEFLVKDWQKLIKSMQVGAERIRQIVLSLRNFSRQDGSKTKLVDIHDGIENTLMILQHRLRAVGDRPEIKVIKEYGQLPPFQGYASQLNQVFMNILSNAIDALDESATNFKSELTANEGEGNQPKIWIRTETLLDKSPPEQQPIVEMMLVRIADNGSGIPEEVISRIFDPFFTTKPLGRGTGLGLSISYQIVVEKHHGQLRCLSNPGQGTEFIIELPVLSQSVN